MKNENICSCCGLKTCPDCGYEYDKHHISCPFCHPEVSKILWK